MIISPPPLTLPTKIRGAYVSSAGNTANTDAYSFTVPTWGEPSPDRIVAVAIGVVDEGAGLSIDSITSVAMGGVTASIAGRSGATSAAGCIAYAKVPTNANLTLAVNIDTVCERMSYSIWEIHGAARFDPVDDNGNVSATSPLSFDLSIPADTFIIGYANIHTLKTFTWTGLIERADFQTESGQSFSSADVSGVGPNGAYTVTSTGSSGVHRGGVAAWR